MMNGYQIYLNGLGLLSDDERLSDIVYSGMVTDAANQAQIAFYYGCIIMETIVTVSRISTMHLGGPHYQTWSWALHW